MQMKMLDCTKWPMKTRKKIWILVKFSLFFENLQSYGVHLFYHVCVGFVESLNWTKMSFGNDQNVKFWGWSVISEHYEFMLFIDDLSFWKICLFVGKIVLLRYFILKTTSYLTFWLQFDKRHSFLCILTFQKYLFFLWTFWRFW